MTRTVIALIGVNSIRLRTCRFRSGTSFLQGHKYRYGGAVCAGRQRAREVRGIRRFNYSPRPRPGHGGPAMVANTWLEATYSEDYPDITSDTAGMKRLFKQFSFPGCVPSHVAPETPGSIHEGGELGYALFQAYGAAFDNPTRSPPLRRRRRGRDRTARRGVALEQVPEPQDRRRGDADPASQRLQDRQPDCARPDG